MDLSVNYCLEGIECKQCLITVPIVLIITLAYICVLHILYGMYYSLLTAKDSVKSRQQRFIENRLREILQSQASRDLCVFLFL